MEKIKVVYLLPGGLFNSGGMERVITTKANYLVEEAGYDVSIVTTEQMGRGIFYPLSGKVHLYHLDLGIHQHFGRESYWRKCISRYQKIQEYKQTLNKLLCHIRPDITVSTLGLDIEFLDRLDDGSIKIGELHFPGNFRQLMARKLSKSLIPNLVGRVRAGSMKRKCHKLSRLVVLTREERSYWKESDPVAVIPNPLPAVSNKFSSCEQKKVIAVGRLVYEKGFDMLVEAWKRVYCKHPDWQLNIYGNGDQKECLLRQISEARLSFNVHIHEAVDDIYEQYREHSFLVFPSRYLEAFGMVLVESMACGIPSVAFDAPCGPKDVIRDGKDGFLIETGNIRALADKIVLLIELETLRKSMGQFALERSRNFQLETVMNQWTCLFETLINQ